MNKIPKSFGRRCSEYVINTSYLTWILLGFGASYFLFFIYPIFLHSSNMMQILEYLPRQQNIAGDLKLMLDFSGSLVHDKPFIINFYPPLASLVFVPLLAVSFNTAYVVITILTIACFILGTLCLPSLVARSRKISAPLVLFLVTGLTSYGFQFELERGQWNVIAVFLSLLSIWIYHYHHKHRYIAYALFSLSIQLKIYPAIFIVMFIKDWRDWKRNIGRLAGLTLANVALLFVLGPHIFTGFLEALKVQMINPPTSIWIGNHSVSSFASGFMRKLQVHDLVQDNHSSLIQISLLAIVAASIFLIMLKSYQDESRGLNRFLLLACTIGALVIPSISHDYKLSILAAPVALFFHQRHLVKSGDHRIKLVIFVLTFVLSFAYSSTLFSYANKITSVPGVAYPDLATSFTLGNNLPALIIMILVTTAFCWLEKADPRGTNPANSEPVR